MSTKKNDLLQAKQLNQSVNQVRTPAPHHPRIVQPKVVPASRAQNPSITPAAQPHPAAPRLLQTSKTGNQPIHAGQQGAKQIAAAIPRPDTIPRVLQPKGATKQNIINPAHRSPVTSAASRPQAGPKVLQAHKAGGRKEVNNSTQNNSQRITTPAHKPQTAPGVLQTKKAIAEGKEFSRSTSKAPVIAPPYKPAGIQNTASKTHLKAVSGPRNLPQGKGQQVINRKVPHPVQQRINQITNLPGREIAAAPNRQMNAGRGRQPAAIQRNIAPQLQGKIRGASAPFPLQRGQGVRTPDVVQPLWGILGVGGASSAVGAYYGAGMGSILGLPGALVGGAVGAVAGGLVGWAGEYLYERNWPSTAMITLSEEINEKSMFELSEREIDSIMAVFNNSNRLKKTLGQVKVKDENAGDTTPVSADFLRGVKRLYIVAHGTHGKIGQLTPTGLALKLLKDISQKASSIPQDDKERRQRIFQQYWQVREITLVACHSGEDTVSASSMAAQLREKIWSIISKWAPPLKVVGVDGYAVVSRTGQIRAIPESNYNAWKQEKLRVKGIKNVKQRATEMGAALERLARPLDSGLREFTA